MGRRGFRNNAQFQKYRCREVTKALGRIVRCNKTAEHEGEHEATTLRGHLVHWKKVSERSPG